MRLIDADALKSEFEWLKSVVNESSKDEIQETIQRIENSPTVDAVEVVHGRWVDHMVRDWRCSVCEKKVPKQVRFDGYCYDDKLNYCPNCGAKMDRKDDT